MGSVKIPKKISLECWLFLALFLLSGVSSFGMVKADAGEDLDPRRTFHNG